MSVYFFVLAIIKKAPTLTRRYFLTQTHYGTNNNGWHL